MIYIIQIDEMIAYLHRNHTRQNVTKAQLEDICKLNDIRKVKRHVRAHLVRYFSTRQAFFKNALFEAIAENDVECLRNAMHRYNGKIDDICDDDDDTDGTSTNEKSTDVVKKLYEKYYEGNMDHQDNEGNTHLHKAVKPNQFYFDQFMQI